MVELHLPGPGATLLHFAQPFEADNQHLQCHHQVVVVLLQGPSLCQCLAIVPFDGTKAHA